MSLKNDNNGMFRCLAEKYRGEREKDDGEQRQNTDV